MKKRLSMIALSIAAGFAAAPAMAADTLVKFDAALGSQPLAFNANQDGTFTVIRNNVAIGANPSVNPGGRPWVIGKFKATIKDDGSIVAKGEGLILAGTNAIGTAGGIRFVGASLFCGADQFDSGAFPIAANGDFVIKGNLSGMVPRQCLTPVLLIRNATAAGGVPGALTAWFAAGIPGDSDD